MNILFYRYDSLCEPDIITGFCELGFSVTEISEEIHNKDFSPSESAKVLSDALFAKSYDFVFSVNFFPTISDVCNIFHIRYVCWTVDSPVVELYSSSIKNEWNRIFLFDYAQFQEFAPYNPHCIFHLPLAANPIRCEQVIKHASAASHRRFSGDVSFVGSLYTEKCPYDRLKNAPPHLYGYLDGIMNAQQKIYGYNFLEEVLPDEIVEEFRKYYPDFYRGKDSFFQTDRAILAQFYLGPKISANERLHTMELLGSRFSVQLYTGSCTKGLPVTDRGRVKTLTEMPLVFADSKINLNITAKSIRSGLPLRIFDILSCGGFLLTNYQPELADYFIPGTELDYYTCDEELIEKTAYYLAHDKERTEIAHNGLECTKKYHTYPARLLEMISLAFGLKKG